MNMTPYSIPYNDTLTNHQRKTFSSRLLTLHQVLSESADENYYHASVIERFDGKHSRLEDYAEESPHLASNTCGTAACAVGHAVWHYEKFPGLPVHLNEKGEPTGINNTQLYKNNGLDPDEYTYSLESTDLYFGPGAWDLIFDPDAYYQEHKVDEYNVTRAMAMKRIQDYITGALGCKLVEDE